MTDDVTRCQIQGFIMNKALSSKKIKWRFTRSGKRYYKRVGIGHVLAAQVALSTIAQVRAIKSIQRCKGEMTKFSKACAIATTIIDSQIAMKKALRWWL